MAVAGVPQDGPMQTHTVDKWVTKYKLDCGYDEGETEYYTTGCGNSPNNHGPWAVGSGCDHCINSGSWGLNCNYSGTYTSLPSGCVIDSGNASSGYIFHRTSPHGGTYHSQPYGYK